MGLFDFLRRPRRGEQPAGPDELRELLAHAAEAGDGPGLERLCRQHQSAILEHFPEWQKVPDAIRNDREAEQAYAQTLVAIAECFARALADPSLVVRLTSPPGGNPLQRWGQKLEESNALMNELRYAEAAALLANLLTEVRELRGTGADTFLQLTYGRLGAAYFHQGQADRAVPHLEQALKCSEQNGEAESVAGYLGGLYEAHRYAGQTDGAAGCAERLADRLVQQGRADQAASFRRQAAIVRAGEPLLRVVAVVDGRTLELDDLTGSPDLRVQFTYQRNRASLRPVRALLERGRQLAGGNDFEGALEACRAAAQADRYEPQAHYEAGMALLHLGRYAEAGDSFTATEERAPGWYQCRADLWLSRQLLEGNVPHELFLATRALEDSGLSAQDRANLAGQVAADYPGLPLLFLHYGNALRELGRTIEAEFAFRRGLEHAAEPDVRTRLLVALGVTVGAPPERVALLRQARDLNGHLVAGASARVALLCLGAG